MPCSSLSLARQLRLAHKYFCLHFLSSGMTGTSHHSWSHTLSYPAFSIPPLPTGIIAGSSYYGSRRRVCVSPCVFLPLVTTSHYPSHPSPHPSTPRPSITETMPLYRSRDGFNRASCSGFIFPTLTAVSAAAPAVSILPHAWLHV